MSAESVKKTFLVAFTLCVVCSVLVSSAAVVLKPRQTLNQELDIKKNLLLAAGLIASADTKRTEIDEAYKQVKPAIIDLATGNIDKTADPASFDIKQTSLSSEDQYIIPPKNDLAKIKIRSKSALIYMIKENQKTTQIVLPVHGKGLYSTLYGFLALSSDTKTITGFSFYDQGETPGLGGEVDNPRWKSQWPGKTVFDSNWQPAIKVVKGGMQSTDKSSMHQVDAISGATMTSRGVENLLLYWLGENGYGPFLARIRQQGGDV